ncbi:hypothetical protein C4552_03930 [Candidatus Parcubacteria bacterium]|nr:MAG: hypothetical protein C4552_03930 [Candidatus Parcubacteria bacterium]
MNKSIDQILAELYEIDPTLRAEEDRIKIIIREFSLMKPDTKLDTAFVTRLRAELKKRPLPMRSAAPNGGSFAIWRLASLELRRSGFAYGALALVIVALAGVTYLDYGGSGGQSGVLALNIEEAGARAFGDLVGASATPKGSDTGSGQELGADATAPSDASPAPMMAFGMGGDGALAPSTIEGRSQSGGGGTAGMTIAPWPYTPWEYRYAGDAFETPADGSVYKRIKSSRSAADLVPALRRMNFDIALDTFSALTVRNLEVVENRDYGYAINVNVPEGMITINADWERWHREGKEYQPLAESEVPASETLISIADAFLSEHRIDTSHYGAPVVDDGWRWYPQPLLEDGTRPARYIPDMISVIYPLKIGDLEVYEEGGMPYGIVVTVDARERKAMNVGNINTLDFQKSSYALEQNVERLKEFALRGGLYGGMLPAENGNAETVALGTPEFVLMRFWRYTNFRGEELLIPALRFEAAKAPQNAWAPRAVMVPLVKEILDQAPPPPVIMPLEKMSPPEAVTQPLPAPDR